MLPSAYRQRNVWANALLKGADIPRRHEIGIDKLMWGADFPHHEGTAPYTRKVLRGLVNAVPERDVRRLLAETAAELYGADLSLLQRFADQVGPSVRELHTPLTSDEVPTDPTWQSQFLHRP